MTSSSHDLHPRNGARFVLDRCEGAPVTYRVRIYLPEELFETTLAWDADGAARLDPVVGDTWAHEEALKLARVLRRDPRERLIRWRGRD